MKKAMKLQVHAFELALRYPFSISRHTYRSIHSFIVELIEGNVSGFGEATLNPYYGITADNLQETFTRAAGLVSRGTFSTPALFWRDLHQELAGNYFALSALDCAAHDLYAKLKGTSFNHLHGINYSKYPFTSYTLGISDVETMKRKIREMPWPVYKLKLGSSGDLAIIRTIRNITDSLIRVDVNGGWTSGEAPVRMEMLAEAGAEFVEQPLKRECWDEMEMLYRNRAIPLMADESCVREEDVELCRGKFDGINIKLSKCGGLTPALRMISRARDLGLKVMIGCMTESTIGISAAAQLLPLVDYADLDGPLLLKEDVATGISYRNGMIFLKNAIGLGFRFKYEKFEANPVAG